MHVLLQFPLTIVQRTNIPSLQPARDAMKVECMLEPNAGDMKPLRRKKKRKTRYVANTPSRVTLFTSGRDLVGLTVYA